MDKIEPAFNRKKEKKKKKGGEGKKNKTWGWSVTDSHQIRPSHCTDLVEVCGPLVVLAASKTDTGSIHERTTPIPAVGRLLNSWAA